MPDDKRKPAAPAARTGGLADLMAGDPTERKRELEEAAPRPQGVGGIDVADDTDSRTRRRTERRLRRILR